MSKRTISLIAALALSGSFALPSTVSIEGAIGSLAVEFYPDVMRHFRRKKSVVPAASAPPHPFL